MKQIRPPKPCYVKWRDAASDRDIVYELDHPIWPLLCIHETIGFLVSEDDTYPTLAQNMVHYPENDHKNPSRPCRRKKTHRPSQAEKFFTIPKAWILKKRFLK